ncbi:MAG: nucleotide pyrophosphohydrolase [Pirellulaceae bacterium]|nr:nucleotide pyrophosphohydrolase [Pirellulaceae bacterium]
MSDSTTTMLQLRDFVSDFVNARDWQQFHSPKNLSMALAIEVAELMEHFQWLTTDASRNVGEDPQVISAVREELADVMCYALAIANELNIDVSAAMHDKMRKNELKYPAEEYRGRYGPQDTGSS